MYYAPFNMLSAFCDWRIWWLGFCPNLSLLTMKEPSYGRTKMFPQDSLACWHFCMCVQGLSHRPVWPCVLFSIILTLTFIYNSIRQNTDKLGTRVTLCLYFIKKYVVAIITIMLFYYLHNILHPIKIILITYVTLIIIA